MVCSWHSTAVDQLKFVRQLDRQIAWLFALEDAIDV
jgi:hypothetical protein